MLDNTLSKKRNATNLAVFIFSIFLIAQKVLGGSSIRHVTDRLWVVIQAEQCLFQCIMPHFGLSHCWSVVTMLFVVLIGSFFLMITWSGAKILPEFFFVSSQEGLHEQARLREDIRMLMADVLPKCIAGSFGVHRSTICCHRHRLCEMRKNNDCPWSQQPPTDRSSQPVSGFLFAKKANMHLIKGNLNIIY